MEQIKELNGICLQLLEIFHLLLDDKRLEGVLLILLILDQQPERIISANVRLAFNKKKNLVKSMPSKKLINTNQFRNGYANNPGNDGSAVKVVRERV